MPRRTGSAGIFAISIALMVYHTDAADSVTLSELVCDSQIYDIKDGDSLLIKWDGTELPKYCRLGFEAPDTSSWTCFNIEKFRLYNCKFYIEIYKNFEKYSSKRYDCSSTDIDDEYCLQSQKITYLKFTYNHTGIASFSPHVRLSVSVQHKEADAVASPEATLIGNILGGLVGLIFFGCVIAVFWNVVKRCYGDLGMPCREACEGICIFLGGVCNQISDLLDCGCVTRRRAEPTTYRDDTRHETTIFSAQPQPQEQEITITIATSSNLSRTVSLDSLYTLDSLPMELVPSAPPADNNSAILPYPDRDPPLPDLPPPSYYDVVTESKRQYSL
ncbi:uncharacterized protein LOC117330863 isoform X3 [Pecten maximus]|uniref:uncharacterized protein LOC117330863 isoform X3 n=1 Tax=Pecten maximus TaxID=6579 RepID=UPI00145810DF|nr:uncharacterized protein LOC117330863 isoform X3 [Pecten maximus]